MLKAWKAAYESTFHEKNIPSLDGLRAVSVFFVIFGHIFLNKFHGRDVKYFIYQDLGVSIFFVISGFLITSLLINEYQETGTISFRNFFIKRAFRIFPAYYAFLLICLLFAKMYDFEIQNDQIIGSFLYLGYYYPINQLFLFAHSWSLAIEEQFYFFWPLIFKFVKTKKSLLYIIGIILLLSPVSRFLTYTQTDIYKYKYPFLLHTRVDTLMFGCAFAILRSLDQFQTILKRIKGSNFFYFSVAYLFLLYPILHQIFLGKFRATIGYTLEGLFIVIAISHLIEKQKTWYFRALNSRVIIHIGSISYGIYLWQQPFTYLKGSFIFNFPYNMGAIYLLALMSYVVIEFPLLKYRVHFLKKNLINKTIE